MGELIQGMRPCVASISQYDLNFFCLVRDKIFKIFGSLTDAIDVFVLCSMKLALILAKRFQSLEVPSVP